jgi:hypothetical protein
VLHRDVSVPQKNQSVRIVTEVAVSSEWGVNARLHLPTPMTTLVYSWLHISAARSGSMQYRVTGSLDRTNERLYHTDAPVTVGPLKPYGKWRESRETGKE